MVDSHRRRGRDGLAPPIAGFVSRRHNRYPLRHMVDGSLVPVRPQNGLTNRSKTCVSLGTKTLRRVIVVKLFVAAVIPFSR